MEPTAFDQLIAILTRSFAELESQALNESELAELSMKQLVYLDTIARLDHPTFSDLARSLGVSKPSVTAIVSKLMHKGYVEKVQSAEDHRTFHVLLTDKGKALNQMHDHIHRRIAEHFTHALDENELHQFARLLNKALKSAFS
jgi:DNA-binding MarR family transcriptional regulator